MTAGGSRRLFVTLPLVLLSLVLPASACSDQGSDSTSNTDASTPVGDSAPANDDEAGGGTVADSDGECSPTAAVRVLESESIDVDLDGDGTPETVSVGRDAGWQVVSRSAAGDATTVTLDEVDPSAEVRVLGGADLDADGSDEALIAVGGGAYVTEVAVLGLDPCGLAEYRLEDGRPLRLLTGASVSNGEAVRCAGDGSIEQYFWSLVPGSGDLAGDEPDAEFEAGFSTYRLSGTRAEESEVETSVIDYDDVSALPLFDCLGVEVSQ